MGAAYGKNDHVIERFAGIVAEHIPEHITDEVIERASVEWIRNERAFPTLADFRNRVLERSPFVDRDGCKDCGGTGWRTVLRVWRVEWNDVARKTFAARCRCEKGQSLCSRIPFFDEAVRSFTRDPAHIEVFVTDRNEQAVPNDKLFGRERWAAMKSSRSEESRRALTELFTSRLGREEEEESRVVPFTSPNNYHETGDEW